MLAEIKRVGDERRAIVESLAPYKLELQLAGVVGKAYDKLMDAAKAKTNYAELGTLLKSLTDQYYAAYPTPDAGDTITSPSTASTSGTGQGGGGGRVTPMARGFEGIVNKPLLALIGEKGPEYVSVRPTNQINSIQDRPQLTSINIDFSGPITIHKEADIQQLYQIFSDRLRSEMKSRDRYISR
jgi:hypothetical protein